MDISLTEEEIKLILGKRKNDELISIEKKTNMMIKLYNLKRMLNYF
jgi:hypothetical protein